MFGAKTMGISRAYAGELGLLRLGEARRAHDGAGAVPRAQRRDGRALPPGA